MCQSQMASLTTSKAKVIVQGDAQLSSGRTHAHPGDKEETFKTDQSEVDIRLPKQSIGSKP